MGQWVRETFRLLAEDALGDVLSDISGELGPLVILCDELDRFSFAGVTSRENCIMICHDLSAKPGVVGDVKMSISTEYSIEIGPLVTLVYLRGVGNEQR